MNQENKTYDLVVGLGRSGVSMARFLRSIGRRVVATDIDPNRTDAAAALEALGVTVQIGSHDQDVFNRATRIIPSPGIPLTMPYIRKAVEKGVTICGELDIFSEHNTTPVIAITGTNGKTTTTTLAGQMAETSGLSCFVCGNIGTPLVEYLMDDQKKDLVVAEISSFQLDLAKTFRPDVGVLLNISEDHLDRYPDYAAYVASKWSLFARQTEKDTAVINHLLTNRDNPVSHVVEFSSAGQLPSGAWIDGQNICIRTGQTEATIQTATLKGLPGDHNRENIAAAALAVLAAGGNMEGIHKALDAFTALPHRTAFVREVDGVRYYNDS
ncbi:MAG: UDP-N-acetylmuramoyl-L-alanine--D-glutamate ligase, partial [Desulfobacterales bacterium]|nr:UDP-N-acetylmuramoyl-L-alanine--D-glutamate ligase [Desulfobacterales bacterium]